jgi:diphthine synthase
VYDLLQRIDNQDIQTDLCRGRLIYEPPRFMDPNIAFAQILLTENERYPTVEPGQSEAGPQTRCDPSKTLAMSLSRIGTTTQRIISGTLLELSQISQEEYGGPLHSVVILGGRVHPLELEFAGKFCVDGEKGQWWKVGKEVYGVVREGSH